MEKELPERLESFNELSLEIDLVLTLARNRLGPESMDIMDWDKFDGIEQERNKFDGIEQEQNKFI